MTGANRLPNSFGSLIDRDNAIHFTFEGKPYSGLAGDCIASALAANGQFRLSRSFKYHRPRGVLTMAGQDANSLVQLPFDPNVLADRERIVPNLNATAQNCNGSLESDRDAVFGRFSRFLPVGFYYKAFYRPKGAWGFWSRMFRRKAGLGVLDENRRNDYFDKQYCFCDVAVVGGGPAGMSAALAAADAGAEVWLIDENPSLGGSLNYSRPDAAGSRADELRAELVAAVKASQRIKVFNDALCNGLYEDNWLAIVRGRRLHKLRARDVVLCTGSFEQPAIFRNNDLPGVMLGSAAQRLIRFYAVRPGQSSVVLAGNNDAYGVALDLMDAGVALQLVADLREQPELDERARAVIARGVKVRLGCTVYEAQPEKASRHLRAVDVRQIVAEGVCASESDLVTCDLLCMSVGYMPAYQLACHAGARLVYDDASGGFSLDGIPEHCLVAGSARGIWSLDKVMADARRAGARAGSSFGDEIALEGESSAIKNDASPNHPWPIFPHPKGKEFVDFDEDLQIADLRNAIADGFGHIELLKRYSTCGMGPSQGRHSALAAARIVAKEMGLTMRETGVTTARPPFAAERLAHSAGRAFYPARRSNMHNRHVEAGARFLHAGAWYRPAYYSLDLDRELAVEREVRNVRNNVGLIDVSTLGGLEIRGPQSAEFLERIYTYRFADQPVGRARYALMTNEAGVVTDDGVACRLGEHHYYVTATTGGVERVYQAMLRWNAQWQLDVDITNVTSAYSAVNIAGPNSRQVLQAVCDEVDLSANSFPYMGVRQGCVSNIPARMIRVGFVGELGYEIHVPQHFGEALWDSLTEAGREIGIEPFGVEAQRVLRLEKGHIIVGQDTDALSTPREVGMDWAVSHKKTFFVGSRSLRELYNQELRRKLTGFVINDSAMTLPQEGHLVISATEMVGRVTSCEFSPTLAKGIGLAYVPPSETDPGHVISIRSTSGELITATTVALPFYDSENARQEIPS